MNKVLKVCIQIKERYPESRGGLVLERVLRNEAQFTRHTGGGKRTCWWRLLKEIVVVEEERALKRWEGKRP